MRKQAFQRKQPRSFTGLLFTAAMTALLFASLTQASDDDLGQKEDPSLKELVHELGVPTVVTNMIGDFAAQSQLEKQIADLEKQIAENNKDIGTCEGENCEAELAPGDGKLECEEGHSWIKGGGVCMINYTNFRSDSPQTVHKTKKDCNKADDCEWVPHRDDQIRQYKNTNNALKSILSSLLAQQRRTLNNKDSRRRMMTVNNCLAADRDYRRRLADRRRSRCF